MGTLEANFKSASLELIEIRNQNQEIEREKNNHNQVQAQLENQIYGEQSKFERAEQSKESKLNNVRAVRGDQFDESPENLMVLAEAESQKTAFLLNALSHMTNNQVMLDQMDQIVAEI